MIKAPMLQDDEAKYPYLKDLRWDEEVHKWVVTLSSPERTCYVRLGVLTQFLQKEATHAES